jgi:hypothetical protein
MNIRDARICIVAVNGFELPLPRDALREPRAKVEEDCHRRRSVA